MEKYERLRVVGRGAYGTVYLCLRHTDKKHVIIKQIPVDEMSKEEKQASLNEAKVLAMLDHPNILAYYENFLDDKSIVIVMEYASGGTLLEYLQHREGSLLSEEDVLHLFGQLVLALHHVHSKQILHRDLKSQNILLDERRELVKLADFGISKVLFSKSKACTVVGTPCYISPELCEGKPYNQKSDIWSLGCVLYELLTLKKPFEANNLPALVGKIMKGNFEPVASHYRSDLRQLLTSMLATDPSKRPLITQIMAHPAMLRTIFILVTQIGSIPCLPRNKKSSSHMPPIKSPSVLSIAVAEMKHFQFPSSLLLSPRTPPPHFRILSFSKRSALPVVLICMETEIKAFSANAQKAVYVNKEGVALQWDADKGENVKPCFPDSKIHITQVACGHQFMALLTNRGIVMTSGQAASGCLGHVHQADLHKPRIVEPLLGVDVVHISCGLEHVMAISKEGLVFSWGRGDNGQMGLSRPCQLAQKVPLPLEAEPCHIVCGNDASFILNKTGRLLAAGKNCHNKLGLDADNGISVDQSKSFELLTASPFEALRIKALSTAQTHSAFITESGHLYTVGSNKWGQLGWGGVGLTHNLARQVEVPEEKLDTFVQVTCHHRATLALGHDGQVCVWGQLPWSQKILKGNMLPLPDFGSQLDCKVQNLCSAGDNLFLTVKVYSS